MGLRLLSSEDLFLKIPFLVCACINHSTNHLDIPLIFAALYSLGLRSTPIT